MRKLHWTQKPENKAKLVAMLSKPRRRVKKEEVKPKSSTRQELIDLAIAGAKHRLDEINRESHKLRLFLAKW